ncbi:MAG: hypothetical protein ACK5WR_20985 [Planctomycetaceae bacterium]
MADAVGHCNPRSVLDKSRNQRLQQIGCFRKKPLHFVQQIKAYMIPDLQKGFRRQGDSQDQKPIVSRIPKQHQQGFGIVWVEAKRLDLSQRFIDCAFSDQTLVEQYQFPVGRKHGQPPSIG